MARDGRKEILISDLSICRPKSALTDRYVAGKWKLLPYEHRKFAGVMLGRAAYHDPAAVLGSADALVTGIEREAVSAEAAVRAMFPYIEREVSAGTRLARITRHMLGAFSGRPGARRWRRILSEGRDGGAELVEEALSAIAPTSAPLNSAAE